MPQYHHSMPFGAELRADGQVRFRLWAPAATEVALCLEQDGSTAELPMTALPHGWFECLSERAQAGSRYRFRLDDGMRVPDPASRFNPDDVHGASEVIDPSAYAWMDDAWQGRCWEETVIYELHVGAFSPEGTYAGVQRRLDYLVDLGVTAIELMPVADFPGAHNWGYDGALLYAPDHCYGRPEELKALVQSAHAKGLMVFLDVVYNHFGPEGNYLHLYAPQFFSQRHHTPWGAAINFDDTGSRTVRDFFIHNALYWLEEYRFDGLRLDAVHSILDDCRPDILEELAHAVRQGPGRQRHIHLILENDHNDSRYLEPKQTYNAQWNDDIHHALHVLTTGEADGYYADYSPQPIQHLVRCLGEGFAYQGEPSAYRHGQLRGTPSGHLSPLAFVSMLQSHDQVGNRAFGERIGSLAEPRALRAATALLLLAPAPPLLFMGEEFAAATPFLYFCDLGHEFAAAVMEGRRREFACAQDFADPAQRERLPDPAAPASFIRSRLDWNCLEQPAHQAWLSFYQALLKIRRTQLVPRLPGIRGGQVQARLLRQHAVAAQWRLGDGYRLQLLANLGQAPVPYLARPVGELLFASEQDLESRLATGILPPWSTAWYLAQ